MSDQQEAGRLAELSGRGLEALRDLWSSEGRLIANVELRNFYRTSADLPQPVKGPDLAATWARKVESMEASTGGFVDEVMHAAEDWLELAELLKDNDPTQLEEFHFPANHIELMRGILEEVEVGEESLESPMVEHAEDPREYEEAPPELDWASGVEEVLLAVAGFVPEARKRCERAISLLFDKIAEWEEYSERYVAFNEPEPDYDLDRSHGGGGGGEQFDINTVFADL